MMYLSEEKRAEIRACIGSHIVYSKSHFRKKKQEYQNGLQYTPDLKKISQILFDARDGKEVFTPF